VYQLGTQWCTCWSRKLKRYLASTKCTRLQRTHQRMPGRGLIPSGICQPRTQQMTPVQHRTCDSGYWICRQGKVCRSSGLLAAGICPCCRRCTQHLRWQHLPSSARCGALRGKSHTQAAPASSEMCQQDKPCTSATHRPCAFPQGMHQRTRRQHEPRTCPQGTCSSAMSWSRRK
jgi:hypothetical protein